MDLKKRQSDSNTITSVTVTAPARLHLGFLGLDDADKGRFGSIGVGITGFSTVVSVARNTRVEVEGEGEDNDEEYIARSAHTVLERFGIDAGVRIRVEQRIPRHQGLGSGTQMALALGAAITALHGIDAGVEDIALATGRGRRSGVGLGVFRHGGFIVDSGRSPARALPTTVFRHALPAQWRFVLVLDPEARGLSGAAERKAFKALPDMPAATGAELCRQVLMQLLPAILEQDCTRFGAALSEIQARIGACFSAAQGGLYASDKVRQALEFLSAQHATGVGQTSWGPTGFAVFPDHERAQQAVDALTRAHTGVELVIAHAQNTGAGVSLTSGQDHAFSSQLE